MAFPKQSGIELPLLQEIEAMGGEASRKKLFPKVALHFPQITAQDLDKINPKGENQWEQVVKRVRNKLSREGEISTGGGIWRITDKGRARLKKAGFPVKPVVASPLPPIDEVARLVQEIKSLTEKLAELAKKGKAETLPTHDELVQKIKEMGEMLGKVTEPMSGVPFKHDCVWRDNRYTIPKLVVEVCDKGNLPKDILSLDWAVANWGAKSILVIFDATDFQAAQTKFGQRSEIYPIKAEDMLKLHSLLQAGNVKALRSIFAA